MSIRSTVGGTKIGSCGDARRTWKIKIVNCYGHVVQREYGEGEDKYNSACSPCTVFANFHRTRASSIGYQDVPFWTTQFVNTILYLQTIAIDGNGGFTYLKHKEE